MGCASSKGMVDATTTVYKPPPTSFAVFDINAIEEPWLKHLNNQQEQDSKKPNTLTHVPTPILQKLNMLDSTDAPQSWDEVSKALQDFKSTPPPPTKPPSTTTTTTTTTTTSKSSSPKPRKTMSFHTLEELDAKINSKPEPEPESKPKPKPELTKAATTNWSTNHLKPQAPAPITNKEEGEGGSIIKPLKDNIFIVRDRMERQKEDKSSSFDKIRRDPLSEFPEKCPPGGGEAVVLYTTSLGGVRKTFEDCNRAREVLEAHRVVVDERDVSLHAEFLRELKELVVEDEEEQGVKLPRVFVKGRYVGGLKELVELNETGRLSRIVKVSGVERGDGRHACGGCGGARFVPCLDCGGSCKVGAVKERCPNCNENGLVHCPACN